MNDLEKVKKEILLFIGYQKMRKMRKMKEKNDFVLNEVEDSQKSNLSRSMASQVVERDSLMVRCLTKSITDNFEFSLRYVFNYLARQCKNLEQNMTQDNNQIYISVLVSFYLDCFVSFQLFFNILMAPIKGKTWIKFEDFEKSIESVHRENHYRAFFSGKQDKKFSATMKIQKLLCNYYLVFFCLVEFQVGQIDSNSLIKIFDLSHGSVKTNEKKTKALADAFIQKASQLRKYSRQTLKFSEFYYLLINCFSL